MELLYLAHRAPFPPDRGDRLRSFHTLLALRRLGRVDVVAQADTEADAERAREGLGPLCGELRIFARRRWRAGLAMGRALLGGGSLTMAWHQDRRVDRAVDELSARRRYDVALAFSSGTGPWLRRAAARQRVMDLCDLDALKWQALGADGRSPKDLLRRVEGRRLLPREVALAEEADLCLLSTEREAADLRSRGRPQRIEIVPQGAAWEQFSGIPPASAAPPVLGFLGQMDYPPNVRAARFLAREVLPALRALRPEARLRILGRSPVAEVTAFAALPGVEVTGEVASVREALGGLAVFCAPLDRGRGMPTKVVEALAAGRPTVISGFVAGALSGDAGRDYLVADGVADWAAACAALLADPARRDALGRAGQAFATREHDWNAIEERLAGLIRDLADA